MQRSTDNPLTNILLLGCGLLLMFIVAEWLLPYQINAASVWNAEPVEIELPAVENSVYVPPHIDDFPEILARPLFFQDRKLPAELITVVAAPRMPLHLELEGIAIAADTRLAVLRDQGNNQRLQLSVGMSYNNWLLEDVTSATATFRRGDDVISLLLEPEGR